VERKLRVSKSPSKYKPTIEKVSSLTYPAKRNKSFVKQVVGNIKKATRKQKASNWSNKPNLKYAPPSPMVRGY